MNRSKVSKPLAPPVEFYGLKTEDYDARVALAAAHLVETFRASGERFEPNSTNLVDPIMDELTNVDLVPAHPGTIGDVLDQARAELDALK